MSKVALRLYNREIEALIDQGHNDEAVAHCQHILKTYPKHLETYRLLGKAHLEARRYADAADIFQRVLLAVPDDFVSHLGMSIVCDEQKDLDSAIWHMERAFEISSTNTGVQGELRRLRGRRDGMEPPKIQLTRGALAQIYTKGGEYQQAITEIKAVLAEDDTRSDMKTLLARAYFRAGMRNESTETCIELLKQYPYSLDANRILVEILPGTSMAQGVDQYKRRIESLDPYLAMVSGSVFETDNIPDNAVMMERFEWDPNSQPVASWNMPDAGASEPETASDASAEAIPDWMKQSGWGQSSGEFKEGPVNFDEPEPKAPAPGGELAAAEIPDWLKAMAPPGATASEPVSAPADEAAETADFDWLAGLGAPTTENPAEQAAPTPAEPVSSAVPPAETESSDTDLDWLNNLGSAANPAAATGLAADTGLDWLNNMTPSQEEQPAQPGDVSQPAGEALPDWLNVLDESQQTAPTSEPAPVQPVLDAVPDQSSGLGTPEPEMFVEQPSVEFEPPSVERTPDLGGDLFAAQEPQAASQAEPEAVPDWLKDLSGEESGQPLSELVSGPGTSQAEQDESLNWLEGLAEKQGAKADELITNPSDRNESVPDWVSKVEETPVEPKAQTPTEYIPEKPIEVEAEPVGELSPLVSGPGTTESEQDDAFKWLENLAAGQGAKSEELLTKPEERAEHAPGWVGEVENPPTELSALISGPGTSSSEQDDALLWLESLAQKQGAKSEELITNPEARTENAPDWVGQVGQVPDQVVQPEPVQETPPQPVEEVKPQEPPVRKPAEEEFVPGPLSELVSGPGTTEAEQDDALLWLESLAQKQGAKPEELITNADERKEVAPDWVAQVGQEPAKSAEPAVPAETPPVSAEAQSEESLAWLQGLAAEEPAAAEQPVEQIPAGQQPPVAAVEPPSAPAEVQGEEESLAWLQGLGTEEPMAAEQPVEQIPAEQQPPVAAVEPPSAPAEVQGEEESLAWLQGLAAEETVAAEQPVEQIPAEQQPSVAAVEPPSVPAEAQGEESLAWLQGLGIEEPVAAEQPVEQIPAEQQPPVAAVEPPPVPAEAQGDESLAWLQGLGIEEPVAAEQPMEQASTEQQPPVSQPADQDWMKDLDTAAAGATTGATADESLDWLNDLGKPAEETPPELAWAQTEQPAVPPVPEPQAVEPPAAPVSSEAPEWLASFGETESSGQAEVMPWEQLPPVEAAAPEAVPEEQPQTADQTTSEAGGITDWLKNLDVQEQATSSAAEQPAAESEELPDWLKDTSADEQPPVPEPVQGWIPTEEVFAQPPAEAEMPATSLPSQEAETPAPLETAPIVPEEVAPAEEKVPEPVAESISTPPQPQHPAIRQTSILGGDKDALAVQRARDLLGRGGLDGAMSEYTKLIKRGKMLEDVIYDLQEAVYSHPVDVVVWQTLGDAYMRSNRLQDALDAYSKAEELLR